MRETKIEILQWCDMCAAATSADEQQLPTTAVRAFVISARDENDPARSPRLIDVCEMHAKQLDDLVSLLHELPRAHDDKTATKVVAVPNPSLRKVACPVCQDEISRSSLAQHVWSRHRTDRRPEPPIGKCPNCHEVYPTPQGMSLHRRHVHGHDALIDALGGVKGYKVTGRESEL